MYVLHRRWTRAFWQATFAQLTQTQREQLTALRNKARGWFTVAVGALLLAAGEIWQIIEHHRWLAWLFWLLIAVMLAVAVLHTAIRMINDEHTRRRSVGPQPSVLTHPLHLGLANAAACNWLWSDLSVEQLAAEYGAARATLAAGPR